MMGPYKDEDHEKGQPSEENPQRPFFGRSITKLLSKTRTQAGEDNQATDTQKQKEDKKEVKKKKHADQEKEEKDFQKISMLEPHHEEPKDTNIVGNITKLLPANTFLMFQTLAPLATNEGHCGRPEIIMTSVMLIILAFTCMLVCFTDTIQCNGKVYHGLVTRKGLWNPSFKSDPCFAKLHKYERDLAEFYKKRNRLRTYKKQLQESKEKPGTPPPKGLKPEKPGEKPSEPTERYVIGSTFSSGNSQYRLHSTDVLHAVLSAIAFATLTMLTAPVSTCFYPNIPSSVVKTLPLLVGFVVSAIFAFSPPARNGVAHPLSPRVPSQVDVAVNASDPKGAVHEQSPGAAQGTRGKGNPGQANPKPDDDNLR